MPTKRLARRVDGSRPEDLAVRPGKVHVFEDALRRLGLRKRPVAGHPILVQDHQLARFDFADRLSPDQIKGAGLGGHQPTLPEPPQTEWAETIRISGSDHTIIRQDHHREGAPHLIERVNHPRQQSVASRMCDQVDDHLTVRRGLEDGPIGFQLVAEHRGVDQVAVMRQRQVPEGKVHGQGLNILQITAARGGIAVVSDGHVAGQPLEHRFRVNVSHKPHRLFQAEMLTVRGHDPGPLLPAMLERVEPQVGQIGSLLVAIDAEHCALIVKLVGCD